MRLSVIGCGHLGAVHAACMAEIGHDVVGLDVDESKTTLLNSGKAWFHEPGLDELLGRNVSAGRLRFTADLEEAAEFARVHFVCVATPGLRDGTYDLSQVNSAVTSLVRQVNGPALIIGKSTVPPGTAASMLTSTAKRSPAGDVDIAWNPEFLREGRAVQDTLMPDRIVVGVASNTAETVLREIYRPITDAGAPLVVTDLTTAELVKGAANAFLATKVSFINALADVCAAVDGDVSSLAHALGLDPRIGQSFLKAGIGYGGGCLPKDVRGLAAFANEAHADSMSELLTLVDKVNLARRDRVVRITVEAIRDISASHRTSGDHPLAGKRVAVWGVAFKPGTDDVRDSPGLDVASRLHALGAQVTVYDPIANGNAVTVSPELRYAGSALEAANDADAILVVTAWPEFAGITVDAAGACVASKVIVDACQGIDTASWREAGWKVVSLTATHVGPIPPDQPAPAAFRTAG
jgi:UDPglucose 6-dehydrogenase